MTPPRPKPTGARVRSSAADEDLFPPAFLRLLALVPAAVKRLRAGVAGGTRAAPGLGGRFLFRGHRPYRPGDDPRRVDWKVQARLDRLVVREFDAERDLLTEVWLDGSESMRPFGGRAKSARAAALASAVGVASGGLARIGILRDGAARVLAEASRPGHLTAVLEAIRVEAPRGSAGLGASLRRLVPRVPRGGRLVVISDLLTQADPGVLHGLAGRGLRGALLHLRVPEVTAPLPTGWVTLRDVESGAVRTLRLGEAAAQRIGARAHAHADRWSRHANGVGLRYLPFAPTTPDEGLLRLLVEDVA